MDKDLAAMSRPASELRSPVRATSIRKLTNILRPTRRAYAQPYLRTPAPDVDSLTPPSSPSLYSLSSDSNSRPTLPSETDGAHFHPLVSPTISTPASSAFEGHGDGRTHGAVKHTIDYAMSELDNDRAEPSSPVSSPNIFSRKSQRSPVDSAGYRLNRRYSIRPQRIIIADKDDGFIDNETSSLRSAGKWGERVQLRSLSPSEWIGSNVHAKRVFMGVSELSPVEPENRSPLDGSSSESSSSPATPRPQPISEINRPHSKPGDTLDTPLYTSRSETITEVPDPEPLTEYRRRPRSASEPRSFLATPIMARRRTGTVPFTPTEYILPAPDVDPDPTPDSLQTLSPPHNSSLHSPMPEDVYFTAAGRRESRMYISPDAAPNHVPLSPRHAHSNSDPGFPTELGNYSSTSESVRYATWNGLKKSGRPFEDAIRRGAMLMADGDSTPVSRKEELWSGEWNRGDIQEVIKELRSLKCQIS
ncbi:hypothetical protein C8R44DRAFT_734488 [Mycena epipterygia]|nr:hypothetical protein C8R44DRAFT_734488 [Mycena epipterygia]